MTNTRSTEQRRIDAGAELLARLHRQLHDRRAAERCLDRVVHSVREGERFCLPHPGRRKISQSHGAIGERLGDGKENAVRGGGRVRRALALGRRLDPVLGRNAAADMDVPDLAGLRMVASDDLERRFTEGL